MEAKEDSRYYRAFNHARSANIIGFFHFPHGFILINYIWELLGFADQPSKRSENYLEQREKLGIPPAARGRSANRTPPSEPTNAMQKVEVCICIC